MKIVHTLPLVALLLAGGALAEGAHWGYHGQHGPKHWEGECQMGKAQSPINIRTAAATPADLPALTFQYQPSGVQLVNNGHTVQLNIAPGSRIRIGEDVYELLQFHFHTPSEEQINGKPADMVAHLVHKNDQGQLAVVAVLFKVGAENAALKSFWKDLPRKEGKQELDLQFNAFDLLPENFGYYAFSGSLTTPPCTEGVRWQVLKEPVTLSRAQLNAFKKIFPMNARPVQPLNDREVKASK
ncbi:carbonic anhydrase [Chitinilyticum piscinae]|uniref:carbonic anhydrase n=1 Tax=Chitinilyticum piscinae TaxID=2866724 RepID=A0A8J7FPL7_9NEIS|nr:carbonic anhydrase family protein [Chitinilyticum piscinae]MBE9609869.1 carbonic anhydrase family protein [Chitinilyticum piscinae]